ncbi:MAG: class C sortase [Atopobiaceae bacterium]|nr:class C sortase [Atopobiaceae bacterium]
MRRIANNILTVLIVLMGVIGAGLLAYPTFSDWWNSMHQSYAIANYDQAVAELDEHRYDELLAEAEAYNAELAKTGINWNMSEKEMKRYNSLLDVTGNGMMGYVEIPKIRVTLPIYHGTRDAVLQVAIGHLSGTSLPVGGKSTHCSVSGHRGLPSARLFTDIDSLAKGDLFTITVLDRVMTYEVDQVRIVLPAELNDLAIEPDQDYVTLVTCTPYGINSHRLLVRGHRTKGDLDVVLAEAVRIEPGTIAFFMAIPVLTALVIWVLVITSRRSRRQRAVEEATEEFRRRRAEREEKGAGSVELEAFADDYADSAPHDSATSATESVAPHEGE